MWLNPSVGWWIGWLVGQSVGWSVGWWVTRSVGRWVGDLLELWVGSYLAKANRGRCEEVVIVTMVEQQGRVFYHKRMKPCGIKEESATYGRESSPSSPVGSLSSSRGGTGKEGEGQHAVDENRDEGVSVHLSQSQRKMAWGGCHRHSGQAASRTNVPLVNETVWIRQEHGRNQQLTERKRRPTDWPTDRPTDRRTDQPTD